MKQRKGPLKITCAIVSNILAVMLLCFFILRPQALSARSGAYNVDSLKKTGKQSHTHEAPCNCEDYQKKADIEYQKIVATVIQTSDKRSHSENTITFRKNNSSRSSHYLKQKTRKHKAPYNTRKGFWRKKTNIAACFYWR